MPTIEIVVAASGDDASKRYIDPTLYLDTDDDLWAGFTNINSYNWSSGMIFRSVAVPQGTTIRFAKLTFISGASGQTGDTVNTKIRAYDADDFPGNLDTEAKWDAAFPGFFTTAVVLWDAIGHWTTQVQIIDSPDIKDVIQEIVDRPGWVSGNDICIFWDDYDDRSDHTTGARRLARSWDEPFLAGEPKLTIRWGPGQAVNINLF